jgi:peptidoglycan hydrolase-like protein with peptidoglycan-binding domain
MHPIAGMDDRSDYAVTRSARRRSFWSRLVHWHLREWLVVIGAVFVVGTVVVNALFLQDGPHPSPFFAKGTTVPAPKTLPMTLPRPRPIEIRADLSTNSVQGRSRAQIVADIQRELAQRGFYDGPADGNYSPKTDIAIRDFEHAAQMRPSTEPDETLLRTITHSTIKAPPVAGDPIAGLLSPSKRLIALQRALIDYGYGNIKATGSYDPPTRGAIEAFERSRKLPVTGLVSDRMTRELAAMTGRPLE